MLSSLNQPLQWKTGNNNKHENSFKDHTQKRYMYKSGRGLQWRKFQMQGCFFLHTPLPTHPLRHTVSIMRFTMNLVNNIIYITTTHGFLGVATAFLWQLQRRCSDTCSSGSRISSGAHKIKVRSTVHTVCIKMLC